MKAILHPNIGDVRLEQVLHALSDPQRLSIVRHLDRAGTATCAEFDCDRSKSTMTHHFRVLREAAIIETRGEGVSHVNSLRRDDLNRRFPGLLEAVLRAPPAQR